MKNTTLLSSSISLAVPSPRPGPRLPSLFVAIAMLLLLLSIASSTYADSATWKSSPATGDWNTAANWTPMTVPNGPSDTATFATSNRTAVSLSANTEVNGIVFNAGASAFTINISPGFELTISGVGITNNSGSIKNFVTADDGLGHLGIIYFTNSATVGDLTAFTNRGGTANLVQGGIIQFFQSSTAGHGTFTNNGGEVAGASGGLTEFRDSATAGNGDFTNNSGTIYPTGGGFTIFVGRSTAANGTFTNNAGMANLLEGGFTVFAEMSSAGNGVFTNNGGRGSGGGVFLQGTSSAANATLIAKGSPNGGIRKSGLILFSEHSTGGKARVEVFGEGHLDISGQDGLGVTVGSIEGDGLVFLGANNLTVGSNNLTTVFSGKVQDGGAYGGTGGSLTKVGTGKLVLRLRNTYTGGTIIKRGILMVNNLGGGSGTGSGPVEVNGGRLGGMGTIAGAVTVGSGRGREAILSPGYYHSTNPGSLTIQSPLSFNSDATYEVEGNSSSATADEVVANGVTIDSGAQFSFADLGSGTLTPGTVFTVINNTAAPPIAGTFSNLPDGSIFTSNGNTYQVSYQGGDGNDLTLTVIP